MIYASQADDIWLYLVYMYTNMARYSTPFPKMSIVASKHSTSVYFDFSMHISIDCTCEPQTSSEDFSRQQVKRSHNRPILGFTSAHTRWALSHPRFGDGNQQGQSTLELSRVAGEKSVLFQVDSASHWFVLLAFPQRMIPKKTNRYHDQRQQSTQGLYFVGSLLEIFLLTINGHLQSKSWSWSLLTVYL